MEEKVGTNLILAGIDDATKCPCIGSIFVAGVVADQKTIKKWKKLGVKDSKLLTRKKREELALIIKETAHAFSIQEITPSMIDNKILNLNEWEMVIFCKIMHQLQKFNPSYALVDNWEVDPILFWERLKTLDLSKVAPLINESIDKEKINRVHIIPEHQADEKYVVVGAASILAKTSSDFQYDAYRELYGAIGSGNPGDPTTRLFVWQNRKNPPSIVRTSWQTYKTLAPLERIEDDPLYRKVEQVTV